jgi:hypothetical protein
VAFLPNQASAASSRSVRQVVVGTLVITADHGRESFTVKQHGGLDRASRAIFLPPPACRQPALFAQQPDAVNQGQTVELAWQAIWQDKTWDLFQAENTSLATPTTWSVTRVTPAGDTAKPLHPGVTLQGSTINTLWADDADGGMWRVRGSRSSAPISGTNAFLPDATAKSATDVYAAYSRINDGTGDYDIYWNKSVFGGVSWVGEVRLLETPGSPSLYPSITYDQQNQKVWVFWREGNGPNWMLRGKRFDP